MDAINVVISNYITTDRYQINVYRTGGLVAIATLEVPVNAGPVHSIRDLPAGYSYDVEVVHYCAASPLYPSRFRKQATLSGSPNPCVCPEGYTPVGNLCSRQNQVAFIDSYEAVITAVQITGNATYNANGIRVYNVGYRGLVDDTVAYDSNTSVAYWHSNGLNTNGRMNIAGVQGNAGGVMYRDFRIATTINITGSARIVYVALSSTRGFRMIHNGADILNLYEPDYSFDRLRAYPVYVYPGSNYFEFIGTTADGECAMVVEVYDCALSAIQNVDTGGEGTLNRLFTTANWENAPGVFYNNFSCFPGYSLVIDGANMYCRRIDYTTCL